MTRHSPTPSGTARFRRYTALLSAALLAVVAIPAGAAYASTALPDSTVITTSTPDSYTFSTTTHYWSVVAVSTAADYDLRLSAGSTTLGTSSYGTGATDFVAINSNLRALGAYLATVTHYSGTGPYYVEQRQGSTITTLPIPANDGVSGPSDPDLAFALVSSADVISVSDIWLNAGDAFWVNTPTTNDGFFLLESNPGDSATFTRTRQQAAAIPGTRAAEGCTLYTANYTGWHGLVVVNPNAPQVTTPGSGIAYALHRYDPTRPNTCPQRNFPAPTPPGP